MATKTWRGVAAAVPGYYEFIPSGWGTEGFSFTLGTNRVGPLYRVAATDSLASLVAGLAALYAGAGPEWAAFTWDARATKLVVYGPADGRTPSLSLASNGSGVGGASTPVQGTGPNFWDNTANWIGGVVPVATNDLIFSGGAPPQYGLPGTGTTFASLTWNPESRGGGLPDTNPAGFEEYMPTVAMSLKHTGSVTVLTSAYVRLDSQPTAARTFTVASPASTTGGLQLTTDANAHVLIHTSGRVLVADAAGEAAQLSAVTVAADAATGAVASLTLGAGVALTTLTQNGGAVALKCAATTVTHNGGDLTRSGAGAITTLTDNGGRLFDSGTGTVTAMTGAGKYYYVGSGGCTHTTVTGKPFGVFLDRAHKLAITNPVVFDKCHLPGPPGDVGPAPFYFSAGTGTPVTV